MTENFADPRRFVGVRRARARGDGGRGRARRQAARLQGVRPEAFAAGASEQRTRAAIAALADFNSHTAKTHTGIYRDLAVRKRKTEIDQQIGIIDRLGREAGVDTPAIRRLVALIHDIEDGKRPMSFATFQDLIDLCTSASKAAQHS